MLICVYYILRVSTCVCAQEGWERAADLLQLEFTWARSTQWVLEPNLGPWQEPCVLYSEHLSSPTRMEFLKEGRHAGVHLQPQQSQAASVSRGTARPHTELEVHQAHGENLPRRRRGEGTGRWRRGTVDGKRIGEERMGRGEGEGRREEEDREEEGEGEEKGWGGGGEGEDDDDDEDITARAAPAED